MVVVGLVAMRESVSWRFAVASCLADMKMLDVEIPGGQQVKPDVGRRRR